MRKYKVLIQVNIKHHYYKTKKIKDLVVQPTPHSQEVMQNYNMMFKTNKEGFMLIYRERKAIDFAKKPIKLGFYLRCNNPYFMNCTDLPFSEGQEVLYFTNSAQTNNYLTKKNVVSAEDKMVGKSGLFSIPLAADVEMVAVKDVLGQQVVERNALKGMGRANVNMQLEAEGKYTLEIEEQTISHFLKLDNNPSDCIGFVELVIDEKVQTWINQNEAVAENTNVGIPYEIVFNQRSTYWKYLLINRHKDIHYEGYTIKMLQQKIKFTEQQEELLPNGDNAKVLVSDQPIQLQELPVDKLQLQMKRTGKGINMKLYLPTPTIDKIVIADKSTSPMKMYSEIYVYL